MTLKSKIYLFNISLAVMITAALAYYTDTMPGNGFFIMAAFILCLGSIGAFITGTLLWFLSKATASNAFFITAAACFSLALLCYFFLRQY